MNYLEIVLKGPSRGGDNMKNWKIYAISFVFRLLNYNVFFPVALKLYDFDFKYSFEGIWN